MVTEGPRPLLKETGRGLTIYYQGKYLYSSKAPAGPARKIAAEAVLLPGSLVFIPSCGLGYGLPELLARLPAQSHVLCVERDPELLRLAEREAPDRFKGDDRLTVIGADSLDPVAEALIRLSPGSFRRVTRLTLCGAARLYPEFYDGVESYLAREIQTFWQNKMTLIHLGLLYVKNLFANLPLLTRARNLDDLAVDRPLLVAGAGPSLPLSLPLVRSLRDRIALLAVDTALPCLLAAGLVPDFVFALEPQFINIKDFLALGDRPIPLLADLSSSPQVIRLCLEKRKCPLYFFSSQFHALSLWERLGRAGLLPRPIPPLGSVGVAAVCVALRLTRAPLLLAGLDFSYPFSRTHARGSPGALLDLAASGRLKALGRGEFAFFCERPPILLADKGGGRVGSDLVLSSYARNLATLIRREKRIFDLGPFGLPLGAPLASTEEGAAAVLAGGVKGAEPGRDAPAARPAAWQAEAVRGFLEAEKSIVREMVDVFAGEVAPGRPATGTLDEARYRLVQRADYAWFHLPEKTALPEFTKPYAARAIIAGRYLLERINRARAALA